MDGRWLFSLVGLLADAQLTPQVTTFGDSLAAPRKDWMGMVDRSASVSIEAAAELMSVDALTIRKWVMDGLLQIERRGATESVSLREVHTLVSWATSRKKSAQRGTLRGLLREAPKLETLDLTELQRLARDRIQ